MSWIGEQIAPPTEPLIELPRTEGKKTKWMARTTLGGTPVYVKRGRSARPQAAIDACKPIFGLQAMGTVWWTHEGEDFVAMRRWPAVGSLAGARGARAVQDRAAAEDLGRILLLDVATGNTDRNLTNILTLADGRLLAIDEMWAFRYARDWRPRLPLAIAQWGLLALSEHGARWVEAALRSTCWVEVAARTGVPGCAEAPRHLAEHWEELTPALWTDRRVRWAPAAPAPAPQSPAAVPRTRAEVETYIASVKWYQSIDVEPGVRTPGIYDCAAATDHYGWPESMAGETFLDVGCNAGAYVLLAKQRGAARAVGIDNERHQITKARTLAAYMGLDVELLVLDLYQVLDLHATFDRVGCLNVFHHFRRPWEAMRLLSAICRGVLVWEGIVGDALTYPTKQYTFVDRLPEVMEHHQFAPTPAALEAMFREVGFVDIERRGVNPYRSSARRRTVYVCRKGAVCAGS